MKWYSFIENHQNYVHKVNGKEKTIYVFQKIHGEGIYESHIALWIHFDELKKPEWFLYKTQYQNEPKVKYTISSDEKQEWMRGLEDQIDEEWNKRKRLLDLFEINQ
jgi:hypothetical protein